ncbi:MAG: hypothetical protein EHM70_13025, partial [Chloroflexota bacterium]
MTNPPGGESENPEGNQPRPEPAARRRPKSLADLRALFDDGDTAKPSTQSPAPEIPLQPPDEMPSPRLDPSPRRRAPSPAALQSLFGESEKTAESPPPAVLPETPVEGDRRSGEEPSEKIHLTFPEGIQAYLSPDLWRKINSDSPRRGVLMNALDRLRSVLYILSTFLPNHLYQEKMRRAVPGLVSGQMVAGSLLFADVSGFTALSERLASLGPQGAEKLTSIMNEYFAAMLDILARSGGILLKFAGDATLVYFPEQENGIQAKWAVRAGQRMLQAISAFSKIETPTGVVGLRMKIGVATGEFLAASIGSASRMEYAILGPAVAQTMKAESVASVGQLVVNELTMARLGQEQGSSALAAGFSALATAGEQEL